MDDVTAFGALIRQERKAQGLRQDELAAASGVGLRFLVELERGKPTVQFGKALAVLAALGCRVDVVRPGRQPG
ncbi:XRE family transcriptional regulator [Novosphingobium barchaimii LL02]|uniref:XRE family transcriptional regulator n=2 Tax=Novosphingobium barchaimii TaxID=1420591 RepID=A0A0J7XKJ6_9SPHN|nr:MULTISPECIES: type II toxin-antitoxin system Y4mF family antitoxin [Novosphingobium]AXB75517.1 transcriptional regulator [Novosphingobium sp. P6W]KIS32468.1 XRE family transcriptional regulator [Novosphingobium sp. P6W]KMS52521.1 XRE family transcriptional regulator [Novosphingobium barchaimii LL02]